jgi:hypothetical protein
MLPAVIGLSAPLELPRQRTTLLLATGRQRCPTTKQSHHPK